MHTEGGALLVTLSGQARCSAAGSRAAEPAVGSRSTRQARLVTPVPEDGGEASQEAALPFLEIPSSPGSTNSTPAGLLPWGRGHGRAIRSETEADTCFELFPSLLVPPNETFRCLSSLRVTLKAQSCQLPAAPVSPSHPPHSATTVRGCSYGSQHCRNLLQLTAARKPFSLYYRSSAASVTLPAHPWKDESCYENKGVQDFGIS